MLHTLIVIPIIHTLEIIYSRIIEVLARENDIVEVFRMSIRDWVT